jgi:hypothetical protein
MNQEFTGRGGGAGRGGGWADLGSGNPVLTLHGRSTYGEGGWEGGGGWRHGFMATGCRLDNSGSVLI